MGGAKLKAQVGVLVKKTGEIDATLKKSVKAMKTAAVIPGSVVQRSKAALQKLQAEVKRLAAKQTSNHAAVRKTEAAMSEAQTQGNKAKVASIKEELDAARQRASAGSKELTGAKAALAKMTATVGELSKRGATSKPSECDVTLKKTVAACNADVKLEREAASEVKQLDAKSQSDKAEKAKAKAVCNVRAKAAFDACEQKLKEKKKAEAALKIAKKEAKENAATLATAKAAAKQAKQMKATLQNHISQPPVKKSHPKGLFLHDNAVWYVNGEGKKSLVKYPTRSCEKASLGVIPEAFEDAQAKKLFLDQQASKNACEGPAYVSKVVDQYANCECSGIANKLGEGKKCQRWGSHKEPWCFVPSACAFPKVASTAGETAIPPGSKIVFGCREKF